MKTPLRCRDDGSFTIIQFTDTHFENGEPEDLRTAALLERVLATETADLVLFTGDVLGPGCRDARAAWAMATAPLVRRGLPWAAVFGNHDDESGAATRAELMAIQQGIPGCLSRPGPRTLSGLGNYLLHVGRADGTGTAATLCCLDAHTYAETDIGGHGWVRDDQIRWFTRSLAPLRQGRGTTATQPVLVFLHIPLPEFDEVWRLGGCVGEKNEEVCCPRINTGFFAAMHLSGRVRGVFCGHDHVNDFQGGLHGIRLCYGRASGYNTYGQDGFARGARIIRLYDDGRDFDTWLRLEDGRRVECALPPSDRAI
ncbi:MAG: hypothetical protein BWK76_20980 [Desulfobulbaceae bacterium A2]|nr:MAG: hypothetical protein BWK76_20980 [Desulfobulbaceae bacterium A2]